MVERVEKAAPHLPAHERQGGPPIPKMQGRVTRERHVGRAEQIQSARRMVADLGDPLRGYGRGRDTTSTGPPFGGVQRGVTNWPLVGVPWAWAVPSAS